MARTPRASYRIQLHPGFTLHDAAETVEYVAALGVSHLYTSPCLQAAAGSTHGYDVVNPRKVSRDLGGDEGHERLCRALARHGMGRVLDVVPNHMAMIGPENAWWWDVLENGPSSPYADTFDVDWEPAEAWMQNRILLPLLGDHYGRILEAGEIRIERREGSFLVRYHEHRLPLAPRSLAGLLRRA